MNSTLIDNYCWQFRLAHHLCLVHFLMAVKLAQPKSTRKAAGGARGALARVGSEASREPEQARLGTEIYK